MKTCRTCEHWKTPHDGMNEPDEYGSCDKIAEKVEGTCEGCVSVEARVDDFEFVTHKTFGCVMHKRRQSQ
jgi:hypothetical protein